MSLFINCSYIMFMFVMVGTVSTENIDLINFPFKFGLCHNPPVHPGLNISEFFENKWYTWKNTGNFFFGTIASCSGTEFNANGTNINTLHYQYEPLLKKYVSLRGTIDSTFSRFIGLRFPATYQLSRNHTLTIPFSVVGTDYDNWAYVYFCRQEFMWKIEMSWILIRNLDTLPTESQLSDIQLSFGAIGFKLQDFVTQDNSRCGAGQPRL